MQFVKNSVQHPKLESFKFVLYNSILYIKLINELDKIMHRMNEGQNRFKNTAMSTSVKQFFLAFSWFITQSRVHNCTMQSRAADYMMAPA